MALSTSSAGRAAPPRGGRKAEEEGLRGNEEDYSDPRNSFLNEVLDRKVGIPISLCVIWMEVARRAGLPLEGVGFPGHFLAKYVSPGGVEVFVDAFHRGEMLSADECVARYRARTGGRDLDRRYLAAVAPRQILARVLHPSGGRVEIAVREGSAAAALGAVRGLPVRLVLGRAGGAC